MEPEVKEWLTHLEEWLEAITAALLRGGYEDLNRNLQAARRKYREDMEGL